MLVPADVNTSVCILAVVTCDKSALHSSASMCWAQMEDYGVLTGSGHETVAEITRVHDSLLGLWSIRRRAGISPEMQTSYVLNSAEDCVTRRVAQPQLASLCVLESRRMRLYQNLYMLCNHLIAIALCSASLALHEKDSNAHRMLRHTRFGCIPSILRRARQQPCMISNRYQGHGLVLSCLIFWAIRSTWFIHTACPRNAWQW